MIKLTVEGVQGRTYRVQYSEDLADKVEDPEKITLLTDRAEIVDITATPSRKHGLPNRGDLTCHGQA